MSEKLDYGNKFHIDSPLKLKLPGVLNKLGGKNSAPSTKRRSFKKSRSGMRRNADLSLTASLKSAMEFDAKSQDAPSEPMPDVGGLTDRSKKERDLPYQVISPKLGMLMLNKDLNPTKKMRTVIYDKDQEDEDAAEKKKEKVETAPIIEKEDKSNN